MVVSDEWSASDVVEVWRVRLQTGLIFFLGLMSRFFPGLGVWILVGLPNILGFFCLGNVYLIPKTRLNWNLSRHGIAFPRKTEQPADPRFDFFPARRPFPHSTISSKFDSCFPPSTLAVLKARKPVKLSIFWATKWSYRREGALKARYQSIIYFVPRSFYWHNFFFSLPWICP